MLDVKSHVQQELRNPLLGAALRPACSLPCLLCQNLQQHTPYPGLPLLLGQLTIRAGGGKEKKINSHWSNVGKTGREGRKGLHWQGWCYHTPLHPFCPKKEKPALEEGPGVNYISLFFLWRASTWDVPGERVWLP